MESLPADRSSSPDEIVQGAERTRVLAAALVELTHQQQRLLELLYGDGLRLVQAAAVLEVSVPAVHAMHGRALTRLRVVLASRGITRLSELI